MASRVVGIIPARYHSTRLPGKLLRPILGKTLLQWTYENAKKALSLDELFVATYEEVISHHVQEFGGRYIYTHANCLNGTECVAAAIKAEPDLLNADVIINIQGDEPCLSKETIDCVVKVLLENPEARFSLFSPYRNLCLSSLFFAGAGAVTCHTSSAARGFRAAKSFRIWLSDSSCASGDCHYWSGCTRRY